VLLLLVVEGVPLGLLLLLPLLPTEVVLLLLLLLLLLEGVATPKTTLQHQGQGKNQRRGCQNHLRHALEVPDPSLALSVHAPLRSVGLEVQRVICSI
jgi:hypothetical protein